MGNRSEDNVADERVVGREIWEHLHGHDNVEIGEHN